MSDIVKVLRGKYALDYDEKTLDQFCNEAADEIEKLRAENEHLATSNHAYLSGYQEAIAEIEKLRAALQPLAKLFLFPDDLGFEAALDIKSDQDWDDDANDMQTEGVFILRRYIRAARAALGEKE